MMEQLAAKLSLRGYTLRSGAADGADTAFEDGCDSVHGEKEIYIAWNGFSGRLMGMNGVVHLRECKERLSYTMAEQVHPAWDRLSRGAQGLHARNCYQVLGRGLDSPSKFLVCWAPTDKQGVPKGGTRTAWVLAIQNNIPCVNLAVPADLERIQRYLED
ncbi:hypothetical protein D3C85_374570 [compost metagenome]